MKSLPFHNTFSVDCRGFPSIASLTIPQLLSICGVLSHMHGAGHNYLRIMALCFSPYFFRFTFASVFSRASKTTGIEAEMPDLLGLIPDYMECLSHLITRNRLVTQKSLIF